MNGYFQLINGDGQTSVCLYPPLGDGLPIDMNEVVDYLNFNGIKFSIPSLYSAAKKLKKEPVEVVLSKFETPPVDEVCRVRVARDAMSASIRFYAPSSEGASLKKKDIISEIEHRGVMKGLLEDVIESMVKEREYCRDYEIAKGSETIPGEDGRLEFYFEEKAITNPERLGDGSIDLKHLFRVNECNEGDIIAKIIPPKPAFSGYTVRGEEFPGEPGKEKRLRAGRNAIFEEETGIFKAGVTGRVKLDKDRILVTKSMTISEGGSFGGNIDFDGNIVIEGDAENGSMIKASGDVVISGQVRGAIIDAGGDIIICQGVDGRGKCSMKAGGNIMAQSFVNAAVRAGRDVHGDVYLHSTVKAGSKVYALGPRGLICGGSVTARNGVTAKVLGNDEGKPTLIDTGSDPALKEEIEALESSIAERERMMNEAYPVLSEATAKVSGGEVLSPSQLQGLKELHALYNSKKKIQKKEKAKLLELKDRLSLSRVARVDVTVSVYPGIRLIIGESETNINERLGGGSFVKERDKVIFTDKPEI